MARALFVLNGPNLNLLGTREPQIYGSTTLKDVEDLCRARATGHGLELVFRQSNYEGDLVSWIHEARTFNQGAPADVVMNPGAYTHTSIALHDAIRGTGVRLIEVHITNVHAREEFRHHSYVSPAAAGIIVGLGVQGYLLAIDAFAAMASPSGATDMKTK